MNDERIRMQNGGYLHGEAFCLMRYESEDKREVEYVWNGRDGVTPFVIMSRRGTALRHAAWRRDERIPDFVPQPGSRIFVDLTEDRAREIARKRVAAGWDDPRHPLADMFETRDEAIEAIAGDIYRPGEPDVQVVE